MNTINKTIVSDYIEKIWNERQFDKLDHFLSEDFTDHSLPSAFPSNQEGTLQWIMGMGDSFEHKTIIDEIIAEDNKVVLKLQMHLKHIGVWRCIPPTQVKVQTAGYRLFKLSANKIIEHWAMIDGNRIENVLRNSY